MKKLILPLIFAFLLLVVSPIQRLSSNMDLGAFEWSIRIVTTIGLGVLLWKTYDVATGGSWTKPSSSIASQFYRKFSLRPVQFNILIIPGMLINTIGGPVLIYMGFPAGFPEWAAWREVITVVSFFLINYYYWSSYKFETKLYKQFWDEGHSA